MDYHPIEVAACLPACLFPPSGGIYLFFLIMLSVFPFTIQ